MTDVPAQTPKIKVLLVEDDQFLLKMYQKKFEIENFDVQVAHDGEEGISKAKAFMPNIIMMDIMMPKLNGLQALEQMKADPTLKPIPVVILTNLSSSDDASVAIQKGAVQYIVKSNVTPSQVVQVARDILTGKTPAISSGIAA